MSSNNLQPVGATTVRPMNLPSNRHTLIHTAGRSDGMKLLTDTTAEIKVAGPTASGRPVGEDSDSGGSGLLFDFAFEASKAITAQMAEHGDVPEELFEDVAKKWGKGVRLSYGWSSETGACGEMAYWLNKSSIWPERDPSIDSYRGRSVTAYGALASAKHFETPKAVLM